MGYQGINQCKFFFIWRSPFACSVCQLDQVILHQGFCGQDGTATVHVEKKPDAQCMLDFIPDSFNTEARSYLENDMKGVYSYNKERKYVSKRSFKRNCTMVKDIQSHPILNFIMQLLSVIFSILLLCLLVTCCKYRRVQSRYQELAQRDSSTSEIVNRNSKNKTAEEDRPQRRNRASKDPDVNTFGKRSADEIKDKELRADTEIELGELDVEFA